MVRQLAGQAVVPTGAMHPPVTLVQSVACPPGQVTEFSRPQVTPAVAVAAAIVRPPTGHRVTPNGAWHPPRTRVQDAGHEIVVAIEALAGRAEPEGETMDPPNGPFPVVPAAEVPAACSALLPFTVAPAASPPRFSKTWVSLTTAPDGSRHRSSSTNSPRSPDCVRPPISPPAAPLRRVVQTGPHARQPTS